MKTSHGNSEVEGNYYERLSIEPVNIFKLFNVNWFQGEAIKYISIFLYKHVTIEGKLKDLYKARHIVSMALDLNIGSPSLKKLTSSNLKILLMYKNQFKEDLKSIDQDSFFNFEMAIDKILIGNYYEAKFFIDKLINSYTNKYECEIKG